MSMQTYFHRVQPHCNNNYFMCYFLYHLTQAVAFIEPLSFDFSKPLNYSLPTLSFGTEWSEENVLKCIIPGFDFKHFYKMLQCPKIMMNATVSL